MPYNPDTGQWEQRTRPEGPPPWGPSPYTSGIDTGGYYPDTDEAPTFQQPGPMYGYLGDLLLSGMGGPEGMQALLDRVRGITAEPFMDQLPWGGGQIDQWLTNRFTGERAARRAGELEERGLGYVNRAAEGAYDRFRTATAATGGRGSSGAAREMAEGRSSLAGARAGVVGMAQEYEDALRQQDFMQATTGLGTLEGIHRGDIGQQMQLGQLFLQSLGPEMQTYMADQGMMQGMMGGEMNLANMMNQFNLGTYGTYMGTPPEPGWEALIPLIGGFL